MVVTFNPAISSKTSFTSKNKQYAKSSGIEAAKSTAHQHSAGHSVAKSFARSVAKVLIGASAIFGGSQLLTSCTDTFMDDAGGNTIIMGGDTTHAPVTPTVPVDTFPKIDPDLPIKNRIAQIADSLGYADGRPIANETFYDSHDGLVKTHVYTYNNDSLATVKETAYRPSNPNKKTYTIYECIKDSLGLGYKEVEYSADANFNKTSPGEDLFTHRMRTAKEGLLNYVYGEHQTTTIGVAQDSIVTKSVYSGTGYGAKYTNVQYEVSTGLSNPHMSPSASKTAAVSGKTYSNDKLFYKSAEQAEKLAAKAFKTATKVVR